MIAYYIIHFNNSEITIRLNFNVDIYNNSFKKLFSYLTVYSKKRLVKSLYRHNIHE